MVLMTCPPFLDWSVTSSRWVTFSMALKDEELYDQIRAAAKRKDYEAGYLDAAAAALGLDKFGYEYKIGGDLDDTTGQVTLTQRVTLTEG